MDFCVPSTRDYHKKIPQNMYKHGLFFSKITYQMGILLAFHHLFFKIDAYFSFKNMYSWTFYKFTDRTSGRGGYSEGAIKRKDCYV